MDLDFEIYRPPRISNRLEPVSYQAKTDEWRPSVDYRFRLDDVEGQFTPAQYFRHRLATSGKEIRMIQKLELRWKRNFELFTRSAIKVQAAYRGMIERRYFNSIKAQLQADLKLKRITTRAVEGFYSEQYATAIKVCHSSDQITIPLLEIEMKCHYRLKNYDFCIKTSNKLIELSPKHEEAHYMQGCSWCQLQRYDLASDILQKSIALNPDSSDRLYQLYAGVAINVKSPNYDSAADSYTQLIVRHPRDFEALFLRACCFECLQEWSAAMKDLDKILAFHPKDKRALLFRARIYACKRNWAKAEEIYKFILLHYPEDPDAKEGLTLIKPLEENTGLDHTVIY